MLTAALAALSSLLRIALRRSPSREKLNNNQFISMLRYNSFIYNTGKFNYFSKLVDFFNYWRYIIYR